MSKEKSSYDLSSLICVSTLHASMNTRAQTGNSAAREDIKQLLGAKTHSSATNKITTENSTANQVISESSSRWEHCLDILRDDFLSRKSELLKLNRARKAQIESHLTSESLPKFEIEKAVSSRQGSLENEALLSFATQTSLFHLLQYLVVKRLTDKGLIQYKPIDSEQYSVNWLITSYLKTKNPKGLLAKHEWSFLKQNIFSWFSPSLETRSRVSLILGSDNFANLSADFPFLIISQIRSASRFSNLGLESPPEFIELQWNLLRTFLNESMSINGLGSHPQSISSMVLSGLQSGKTVAGLKSVFGSSSPDDILAFGENVFDRYLSELMVLWDHADYQTKISFLSNDLAQELDSKKTKSQNLFPYSKKSSMSSEVGACFHTKMGRELEDISNSTRHHKRGSPILISSRSSFWCTENSDQFVKIRDQVLKKSTVKIILDLRQVTSPQNLPSRSIVFLEKCSSKEIRDSNRPLIIRARGSLESDILEKFSDLFKRIIQNEKSPGEINTFELDSINGQRLKIESMMAAANQGQLKTSPWITLSDPIFYEASAKIRRSPSKAFSFSSILKWSKNIKLQSENYLYLSEDQNGLYADTKPSEKNEDDQTFLFMPEQSVSENIQYFYSQINSAPIQFWYALESEHIEKQSIKSKHRQSEQRLKLMPLVRLFSPNTLLPTQNSISYSSIKELKARLSHSLKPANFGDRERTELYWTILNLESSLNQNLAQAKELTRHIFPELKLSRLYLPESLPEICPSIALSVFSHLDQRNILQHPSIQIQKIRPNHDFKITDVELSPLSISSVSELIIYHGKDAYLKIIGPSFYLTATKKIVDTRLGRPWLETAKLISLPTDSALFQIQLREVINYAADQIKRTRDLAETIDQIFLVLFNMSSSFEDQKVLEGIKKHLNPTDVHSFTRNSFENEFTATPASFGLTKGLLQ
ncbi:MAG: hypothetical protein M9962_14205 [Oligoflexia bacterium]|nr:hypothetical protein [Oligoflexia bacterium]